MGNKYDDLTRNELIERLEILENKYNSFLEQQRKDDDIVLHNKISLRQTIANLLTTLLSQEADDSRMDKALALILEFFDVDRAYIASFDAHKQAMLITDEVTKDDLFSIVGELSALTKDDLPWWFDQMLNGRDIIIQEVNNLPAHAIAEKELLQFQHIRSLMALPLYSSGNFLGFIGLDAVEENRDWSLIERENLRTFADIITIALESRNNYQKMLCSYNNFQNLYNNMPVIYYYKKVIYNELGIPVDFIYEDVNPAGSEFLGIDRSELIGQSYNVLVRSNLSRDVFDKHVAVVTSKSPLIIENIIYYKNKFLKQINYSPLPGYLVTLGVKLFSEEELEEKVLLSEAKFGVVFEKLPIGVEIFDTNGILLDINKAGEEILNMKREDILSLNLFESSNLSKKNLNLLTEGKDVEARFEFSVDKSRRHIDSDSNLADGKKQLYVKATPLKGKENTVFGYVVIIMDETDKFRKDERNAETFAELKAVIGNGDSLMWEYDVADDAIYVNLELRSPNKVSLLKADIKHKWDFYKLIHPQDKTEVCDNHFERLLRGEIAGYNIRYRRLSDNGYIWVKANVQTYKFNKDGTPNKIIYYLSNIDEEVKLEDKLRSVENEHSRVIEALPDTIFIFERNCRIVNGLGGSSENLILPVDQQIRRTLSELLPADVSAVFEGGVQDVFASQEKKEINYWLKINDERRFYTTRIFPFDDSHVMAMVSNTTERMNQHQKIISLNTMLQTILNNVPVIITVKNVNDDYRIMYFNKAAEVFSGLLATDAIGKTDFDIFKDKTLATEVRNADLEALKEGGYARYGVSYITPTGQSRIVNVLRIPISNLVTDEMPLLIVLIWDITEQQQREIELVRVREADNLKSAFLANMSHEIRTPLNAIVGFSGILAETDNAQERLSYMEIINKNNDLLLQLINDILDFSKIESGTLDYHVQQVDIKDICMEAYTNQSLKMHEDVKLIFDAACLPSVMLNTDPKRVMQVISNFLTNAFKFTTKGSITIRYEIQANVVIVSVTDTGIGISSENCENIFNRFVKLNEFKQGTGLGLSISKMIIEHLGGKVGVTSHVGLGSTFWFSLPVLSFMETAGNNELVRKIDCNAPDILSGKNNNVMHKILIAEDVDENYRLLEVLFRKKYQLVHAHNGQEAVEMFKEHNPELILMDIKMPVMDGFEATKIIRTMSEDIPILALTAFAFEREKEMAKECRFSGYIVKPIDVVGIRKTVASYFEDEE